MAILLLGVGLIIFVGLLAVADAVQKLGEKLDDITNALTTRDTDDGH